MGCGPLLREANDEPRDETATPGRTEDPAEDRAVEEAGAGSDPAPGEGTDPPSDIDSVTEPDPPESEPAPDTEEEPPTDAEVTRPTVEDLDPDLASAVPREWGETVIGVRTHLAETEAIALTLDACGGRAGDAYDQAIIDTLRDLEVPATLFINARWARSNPRTLEDLAGEPLFELANHGTEHRPLSVKGRSAYGITGTASADAALEEVWTCQQLLLERTGTAPRFFRSGTAHYDEVAVRIVQELGLEVAGYSVLGDAGATFTARQVEEALTSARPRDIVLLHMNQPSSGTAAGIAAALPTLLARGARFATLGANELT